MGGEYRFTPQFSLEAAFYNIDTDNRPEIGKAYWAEAYSLLADYQFTHSFDTSRSTPTRATACTASACVTGSEPSRVPI